ncbi:MAG: hypothetical protein Kilf2KO_33200 [Rhodospirillales bacterium]
MLARFAAILALCVLAGCAALLPPEPYAGETQGTLDQPFDRVWPKAVAYFADKGIPVSILDKSSGFIAANDIVNSEGRSYLYGTNFLACDTLDLLYFYKNSTATLSAVLQPEGADQTSFRLKVTGRAFYKDNEDGTRPDRESSACQSSGRFETGFLAALRQ